MMVDDLIKVAETEKKQKDAYLEMLDSMDEAANLVLQNRSQFSDKIIAAAEQTLKENAEWRKRREVIPYEDRLGR